jgi:hypothetical protein
LKRKLALLLLAAIPAALMPLGSFGLGIHIHKKAKSGSQPAEQPASSKYEVMVGYGYTSLNQLNQSRHALQGVKVGAARDFGKYAALVVNGDYFKPPVPGVAPANPGDPSVYSILAGPEVRFNLYDRLGGFAHGLIGAEHTGGEQMRPANSFAGGPGIGMSWNLSRKFYVFASGDKIFGSFSFANPATGSSPHRTSDARATLGIAFRF